MDFKPTEIKFKRRLACTSHSAVFLAIIRDNEYVLKVYHGCGPRLHYDNIWFSRNIFRTESLAYRRLKERGVCDHGIVPQYYGALPNLDPALYQPWFSMFLNDEFWPSAIILEYIPNMKQMSWENYTPKLLKSFVNGLKEIHAAGVSHGDLYPRNLLIVENDPTRKTIWLDFDSGFTSTPNSAVEEEDQDMNDTVKKEQEMEHNILLEIGELMEADNKQGKFDVSRELYYW